jgi:hypothetical protein
MGNSEFILDFVLRMQRPHHIVSRVIVPHSVLPQMITALEQNLAKYEERFGKPMDLPKGDPSMPKPSIEEVYDDLKLPDEELSGRYANAVMISHSPAEFCFDFITSFFPRSAVSARVFLSAPQVPRMLDAIRNTYKEFQKRMMASRIQQMPPLRQPPGQSPLVPPPKPHPLPPLDLSSPYYTPPEAKAPPPPPPGNTDAMPPATDEDATGDDEQPRKS